MTNYHTENLPHIAVSLDQTQITWNIYVPVQTEPVDLTQMNSRQTVLTLHWKQEGERLVMHWQIDIDHTA